MGKNERRGHLSAPLSFLGQECQFPHDIGDVHVEDALIFKPERVALGR